VEGPHALSASNLFKYAAPHQGVILFRHHDPLSFTLPQLSDLLSVSSGWFSKAAAAARHDGWDPTSLNPLLVWNCLPRAGASQFHGHAQVMLSAVPFPQQLAFADAAERYCRDHPGRQYHIDAIDAHAAAGLLARAPSDRTKVDDGAATCETAAIYASLCPWKDSEIVVHCGGAGASSPAFAVLFYAALRALIDDLGVRTFNAAIYPLPGAARADADDPWSGPVVGRVVGRGRLGSLASDWGGLEVFGSASIGHTDPFVVKGALDSALARAFAEVKERKKEEDAHV
jgi:hypothetical protein